MEEILIKHVAGQGFSVALLMFLLWFLYRKLQKLMDDNEKRMEEMEERIELLHQERKQERSELVSLATDLRNVIKENSLFIEKLSGIITALPPISKNKEREKGTQ